MKKIFFAVTFGMCIFFSACSQDSSLSVRNNVESFVTIEDDLGNEIIFKEKPKRIVVTSASFMESLHSVGANIVGYPESKNKAPEWAKDIPNIGHVYQIDVERLLACNPDLVVINAGMNEKILDILNKNDISALVIKMKTYDEVKHALKIFSKLSDNPEKGEQLIKKMDNDIQNIVDKIPKEKKQVTIIHSTTQGMSIQTDNSIAGNIVKMLGWENITSDILSPEENTDSIAYSMETLTERNPEIIFVTSMGNPDEIKLKMDQLIASNEAWQSLQAITHNRLYYLPQDMFLLSPGLDYPKAVKYMARLVYPDIFK